MKNSADYSRFDNIDDPEEETYYDQACQCKKEGNEAFKGKKFDAASSLYREGINKLNATVKKPDEKMSKEEKLLRIDLRSNMAAAYLKLEKHQRAVEEATEALKLDKAHTKSLFRRAQGQSARGKDKDAMRDIVALLQIDAANKAGLKMRAKLVKKLHPRTVKAIQDEFTQKRAEAEKKKRDAARRAARKKQPKAETSAKPTTTSAAAPRAVGKLRSSKGDDKDAEGMRGYKKTKDGRTTTFFHRELDEKAKELIGSITPTKIECPRAAAQMDRKDSPASAWNSAGTVEEKDKTTWAKVKLRSLLASLKVQLKDDESIVQVTEVEDLEGDASHVFMRGRMRYLFEFGFKLQWKATVSAAAGKQVVVKGASKYAEICNDTEAGEFCGAIEMSGSPSTAAAGKVRYVVKALEKELEKAFIQFSSEFRGI